MPLADQSRVGDEQSQAFADQVIAARVRPASRDRVFPVCEKLLLTIWDRLEPTLGGYTVRVLFDRALGRAVADHPLLAHLDVSPAGVDCGSLRKAVDPSGNGPTQADADRLRASMHELIKLLFQLIAVLTGDIIVNRLLAEFDESPTSSPPRSGESGDGLGEQAPLSSSAVETTA